MLKTTATEARGAQREKEGGREVEAERMGGRGGQCERRGVWGGADRREMRWGWREQLINCIQLRLQYSQPRLSQYLSQMHIH